MKDRIRPVICAFMAAVFYAVNTPLSKILLESVPAAFMAAFLYLGAGTGVGIMYIFRYKQEKSNERLGREDLPYTAGMVLLDILAPILLMLGIRCGSAANASLLGNFEIVATTMIAFFLFREGVSRKLAAAIGLITLSSIILSFEGGESMHFSLGSIYVLLAASCWGLENNCTRRISEKSSYQIVTIKGLFSGGGSFVIASLLGEKLPDPAHILLVMLLGFVAYGLSIFLYVRAQKDLGAARTSAYYALNPFIGAFLSFLLLGEALTASYMAALMIMIAGTLLVVMDTVVRHHMHQHTHVFTHTHDGTTHTHTVVHSHDHDHYIFTDQHSHRHSLKELERECGHSAGRC